jgi:hypothetical protein
VVTDEELDRYCSEKVEPENNPAVDRITKFRIFLLVDVFVEAHKRPGHQGSAKSFCKCLCSRTQHNAQEHCVT